MNCRVLEAGAVAVGDAVTVARQGRSGHD
jgi:MOSC domain-containing protein YiiM